MATPLNDPRLTAIPDVHGHAKGEHKPFVEERPIAYSARMLFLWFYHACQRGAPLFLMVSDHINYLTFEDPGAVHTVRRALKLAQAGDLYGAAETAGVEVGHAHVVSQAMRRGMRFSIGAELDNDPRARPDAQNIVDAMRPDGLIRSVHFLTIEHPEKGPDWQWPFDNPEFKDLYDAIGTERVWELYVAKLLDDVEKLPGHIVGHFYVPATFGHWPAAARLEQYEDRLLDACAARGMAVEINTRFLYRDNPEELKQKYRGALARLMRKAKARGVGIAIGSDAHSPKDQGNAFGSVLKMLDEAKINEIVFPVGGRLARVALRATKEHLQKIKAQEPLPAPGSSISGFGRAELGLPEREEAQEREKAGSHSKSGRDLGPRKRASSPARSSKRPVKDLGDGKAKTLEPPKPVPKGRVRATAAAKPVKPAKTAPKSSRPAPKAPAQAAKAAKPAKPAKPAVKSSSKPAAKKPAGKTVKAAAKSKASRAVKAAKAPSRRNASAKKSTPAKRSPAKKASGKKAAPGKKAPAKKRAGTTRKVSAAKRTATKKSPSKRR